VWVVLLSVAQVGSPLFHSVILSGSKHEVTTEQNVVLLNSAIRGSGQALFDAVY